MAVNYSENCFTFNGERSIDHGLYVSGDKTFNSAEKEYEKVSVPGRNGDLVLTSNRFKNVELTYHAIVIDNYEANTEDIRSWLLSPDGYCKLSDVYHPGEYRKAMFAGPIDFETYLLQAGETDITFDCMPQRWLNSGDVGHEFTAESGRVEGSINNETRFDAKPKIIVKGFGYLQVGSTRFYIHKNNEAASPTTEITELDCELQDCYDGNVNKNSYVEIDPSWPVLKKLESTTVVLNSEGTFGTDGDTYITDVIIIPRWWTI